MRYTWRLIFTFLILFFNILNYLYLGEFSFDFTTLFSLLLNAGFCWLIGLQIDRYRFSKRELGSARTVLMDYSFALDSVGEAIGITNEEGNFVFVNDAHAKLYSYKKDEILTLNWKDCYSSYTSDYLTKNAIPLLMENGYWRGEVVGVRKDGSTFPQEISMSLIKESQNTICVVRDITEQKNYEEMMKYAAEHNELTDLPNRRRLLADLASMESVIGDISLLFIDLDRFKMVNDNYGHECGDELLKEVARRLLSFKNDFVNVYHQGGDEFIIIIKNQDLSYGLHLASKIIDKVKEPFAIDEIEIFITTSIGISRYPDHTNHFQDLIKMADTAMYHAKIDGKDTSKFFNKKLELQLERKTMLESELRKAVINEDLFVLYQPKFDLANMELVGLEALIRWKHPELGIVSPGEFIPIAEETGLICGIGKWVIEDVFRQMRIWQDQGYSLVKVSVNVSQRQFRDKVLVETIRSCLDSQKIDSAYFEIEITESVMGNLELIIPILNTLKDLGVGISIDDFGTGYSSLNILKELPIDTLKIDQSFIRDLLGNPKDNPLVRTILEIGNILGLNVVAEGIETEDHLNHLLKLNCPIGQGYYFSRPIAADELENKFLEKTNELVINK